MSTNRITVTAAAVAGANVDLIMPDDNDVASDVAMVDLAIGDTVITATAAASDGTTQRDCTLTVTPGDVIGRRNDCRTWPLTLSHCGVKTSTLDTTEYTVAGGKRHHEDHRRSNGE